MVLKTLERIRLKNNPKINEDMIQEFISKDPSVLGLGDLTTVKREKIQPYLPIHPKSYRKQWQYDDEAYNYIYDFLSAFTEYNFSEELQNSLDRSRFKVSSEFSEDELFDFLLSSATKSNFRRFQSVELEDYYRKRIQGWKKIRGKKEQGDKEKGDGQKQSEIIVGSESDVFQL